MIVLIDNYDSFSYNLYQLIGKYDADIHVYRNDKITVDELDALQPDAIILSPGPGKPSDAGICEEVVKKLYTKYPILGVCLGHQAICEAFGATVTYAKQMMHGKTSEIQISPESRILKGLKEPVTVARYHSLAVREETLPKELSIAAKAEDGEILSCGAADPPGCLIRGHSQRVLEGEQSGDLRVLREVKGDPVDAFLGDDL